MVTKIKELRESRNITQEKLAKILGVSRSTVSMYEINASEPDFTTMQKIADYFDVSVDFLLGREDINKKSNYYPAGLKLAKDERLMIGGDGTKHIVKIPPDRKKIVEATLDIDLDHSNIDNHNSKKK